MSPFDGQGGLGGGMGLAALIMPISIAAFVLGRPAGPIRKLMKAGALSPETARRARGVGIPREFVLRPYARLGVAHLLLAVGEHVEDLRHGGAQVQLNWPASGGGEGAKGLEREQHEGDLVILQARP